MSYTCAHKTLKLDAYDKPVYLKQPTTFIFLTQHSLCSHLLKSFCILSFSLLLLLLLLLYALI